MTTIDIDFDVFKALTLRRASEEISYNDVLRELLGLPPCKGATGHKPTPTGEGDWISKGVRFPAGTEFRGTYKGETVLGRVEGGALVVNGEPFQSPSAAAVAVTGTPVNGWTFWECRLPGKSAWQILKALRK